MTDVGLDWYTEKGSLYAEWREEIHILILWDIRHDEQGTPDMGLKWCDKKYINTDYRIYR